MKKKHKLNFIIPLVIYPFDILVSFGETDRELGAKLKSLGIHGQEDLWHLKANTGVGRTCRFDNGGTLIRLKNFPDSEFDYGCMQHEAFHAVCYIMNSLGMSLEIGVSD